MFARAFLLSLAAAAVHGDDGFVLSLLQDPLAVCLDGSPGGFYLRPGLGPGASTWLIEMEGGGWCTSVNDCIGRSKGPIGSSSSWPPRGCPSMDGGSNGMLSSDCAQNPHFCNATGVHMNYCDGASFSSAAGATPVGGGVTLHFSGAFIFNATIAALLKAGLSSATSVILKGCSAGGLGVYLHCDLFSEMLAAAGVAAKVVCMPDAGSRARARAAPAPREGAHPPASPPLPLPKAFFA